MYPASLKNGQTSKMFNPSLFHLFTLQSNTVPVCTDYNIVSLFYALSALNPHFFPKHRHNSGSKPIQFDLHYAVDMYGHGIAACYPHIHTVYMHLHFPLHDV